MTNEELCVLADAAANKAYSPYSKFRVGAALLTKSGKIFTGCNVENASYGLTVCAERVVIFSAIASGENDFEALAVTAKPCGACLQVLAEFVTPSFRIIIGNEQFTLADFLPFPFSGKNIK